MSKTKVTSKTIWGTVLWESEKETVKDAVLENTAAVPTCAVPTSKNYHNNTLISAVEISCLFSNT